MGDSHCQITPPAPIGSRFKHYPFSTMRRKKKNLCQEKDSAQKQKM